MTGFYRNMATGDYDEFRDTEDVLQISLVKLIDKIPLLRTITITESPEASNSASGRIRMAVIRIL